MAFASVEFVYFFLPVYMLLYCITKARYRRLWLVIGEVAFIGIAEPLGLFPLAVSIFTAYFLGILIHNFRYKKAVQNFWLILAIVVNSFIFLTFAYSGLNSKSLGNFVHLNFPVFKLFITFGVGVYTLHSISYCIDVSKGLYECEHRFFVLASYIGFFPVLTSGPILNFNRIRDEISAPKISSEKIADGIGLFLRGLAEKLILSNSMGQLWTQISEIDVVKLSVVSAIIQMVAFGFHFYFELAAYSHMARGFSLMLGFKLPKNFKASYSASSVTEFFRHFNITVNGWFRRYVYDNMGSNKKNKIFTVFNFLVMALLISMWYGFGSNFALWALYIGLCIVLENLILKFLLKKTPTVIKIILTFICITFSWTFLSCDDLNSTIAHIKAMLGFNDVFVSTTAFYFIKSYGLVLLLCVIFSTRIFVFFRKKLEGLKVNVFALSAPIIQLALLLLCTAFLVSENNKWLEFLF